MLVLFVFGLVLLSSSSGLEGDERPPVCYEIRRALRALPLVAVITVALALLSQVDFLFPKPAVNPAETPQKPKTVPLSKVVDRPLFRVTSELSGPWRMGSLDVYDGTDWRLAAVNDANVKTVPNNGIIDRELAQRVSADFNILGLTGAVLPGLSNPVAMQAKGIIPAFDYRSGNIRLASGTLKPGQKYTVFAAGLPTIDELKTISEPLPPRCRSSPKAWAIRRPPSPTCSPRPTACRRSGTGSTSCATTCSTTWSRPGRACPSRLRRNASTRSSPRSRARRTRSSPPRRMLARWIGLPSRIAFGFDGGEKIAGRTRSRFGPKNGATFVEVYFPGFKWVPVVGTPKQAKPTVSSDPGTQQTNPNILPSDDVTIQVYLPVITAPKSVFGKQLLRGLLIGVPIALLLLLSIYSTYPALAKVADPSRRRTAALANGTPRPHRAGLRRVPRRRDRLRLLVSDRHAADVPRTIHRRRRAHRARLARHPRACGATSRTTPASNWRSPPKSCRARCGVGCRSAQPGTVRFVAAVSRLVAA